MRQLRGCIYAGAANAASVERLAPGDAHVAVRLLVVDEHVGGKLGLCESLGVNLRRLHDVEFANLARPGQHLDRVLVV